jgi:hypothetical protein
MARAKRATGYLGAGPPRKKAIRRNSGSLVRRGIRRPKRYGGMPPRNAQFPSHRAKKEKTSVNLYKLSQIERFWRANPPPRGARYARVFVCLRIVFCCKMIISLDHVSKCEVLGDADPIFISVYLYTLLESFSIQTALCMNSFGQLLPKS